MITTLKYKAKLFFSVVDADMIFTNFQYCHISIIYYLNVATYL